MEGREGREGEEKRRGEKEGREEREGEREGREGRGGEAYCSGGFITVGEKVQKGSVYNAVFHY